MKVTREVIYDLLPGYFAGEASDDTRALVDEFLRDDPEFARMMARFRAVFQDRHVEAGAAPPAGEREAFNRARALLEKRSELWGYVVAFALAALFVPAVLFFTDRPMRLGMWAMTAAFGLTSLVSGVQLALLVRRHPELRR